jgi:hypothetical protein
MSLTVCEAGNRTYWLLQLALQSVLPPLLVLSGALEEALLVAITYR